jgi:hypothetical protein
VIEPLKHSKESMLQIPHLGEPTAGVFLHRQMTRYARSHVSSLELILRTRTQKIYPWLGPLYEIIALRLLVYY